MLSLTKKRFLLVATVFSITFLLLVQTHFYTLFKNPNWTNKFHSLDPWTTSNSRRTVLSSGQQQETRDHQGPDEGVNVSGFGNKITNIFGFYNPLHAIPIVKPDEVSRIFLVTYFRSGSSFLGDILQQNFRTFYSFEPLHFLESGKGNRISDDKIEDATNLINNILKCKFPLITPYIKWALRPENRFLFKWNTFLWSTCRFKPVSCFNPSFLKETCIRSPVQVMKFTRFHMRQVATYFAFLNGINDYSDIIASHNGPPNLSDTKLDWIRANATHETNPGAVHVDQMASNVIETSMQQIPGSVEGVAGNNVFQDSIKVVFLVRDPRGIFNSRKHMTWCANSPCSDIQSLCEEMDEDLIVFSRLKQAQPDKFHLIRYEDLSLNPLGTTSVLFNRLKVPFSSAVQRYIMSHTHVKAREMLSQPTSTRRAGFFWSLSSRTHQETAPGDDDPYSTRRNSKDVAFEWIHKLESEELSAIESYCSKVIEKLGYRDFIH